MPGGYNASLQQTVEILLRTGGQGDAQALRDVLIQLEALMVTIAKTSRDASTPIDEMAKALLSVARDATRVKDVLAEVEKQEMATAKAAEEAAGVILRAKIDAYARTERAAEQAAKAEAEAAGEAMRARIDALARTERAAEQAAKREIEEAAEVLRAKIDALARAERAEEQAAEAAKTAAGEVLRAKIDLAARAERAAEQEAERVKMAMGEEIRARAYAHARFESILADKVQKQKQADGDALRSHIDALARDERSTEEWAVSMQRLHASVAQKQRETGYAAQAAARGVLELSRGMEDFATGGFIGILNNIPTSVYSFSTALGISATATGFLTAGISAAATATYVLYTHWHDLSQILGRPDVGTAAAEMKNLEEVTRRTADQEERLKMLREGQSQKNAALHIKGQEELDQEKAFDAAVRDAGGSVKMIEALKNIGKATGEGGVEQERAGVMTRTMEDLVKQAKSPEEKDEIRSRWVPKIVAEEERAKVRIKEFVESTMGNARSSTDGLYRLIGLLERDMTGAIPARSVEALQAATPENVKKAKAQQQLEEEVDTDAELMTQRRKLRDSLKRDREQAEKKELDEFGKEIRAEVHELVTGFHDRIKAIHRDMDSMPVEQKAALEAVRKDVMKSDLGGDPLHNLLESIKDKDFQAKKEIDRDKEAARKEGEGDAIKMANRGAAQAKRAESEAETAARKAGAGMMKPLIHDIAANEMARMRGMGIDNASHRAMQEQQVAQRLQASGQDPALAPRVVNQAEAHAQHQLGANLARFGDMTMALAVMQQQNIQQTAALNRKADAIAGVVGRNRQALDRGAQKRPSIQQIQ